MGANTLLDDAYFDHDIAQRVCTVWHRVFHFSPQRRNLSFLLSVRCVSLVLSSLSCLPPGCSPLQWFA